MKNFSNTYIFTFSVVMVVLVAALLSVVAMQLKPKQDLNIKVEQMQNILGSVKIETEKKSAEDNFNKYISQSYIVGTDGNKKDGEAFDVDLKEQLDIIEKVKQLELTIQERRQSPFAAFMTIVFTPKKVDKTSVKTKINQELNQRQLPVYVCNKNNETLYILPLRGKGLWGPIWGYIALKEDFNTVYGAVFDHKTETPGLGAEINTDSFESMFTGKKLFDGDVFKSIEVAKGGKTDGNPYAVDAISGGTITSKGVEAMLYDCIKGYLNFFEQNKKMN